jgi:probable rRNA maturation factor
MILNRQRTVRIAQPALESFLSRMRHHLRLGNAEVAIAFVTDAEIARLNHAYRKKKGPTDVLSFPALALSRTGSARTTTFKPRGAMLATRRSPLATSSPFLGDIAISPATARRNAKSSRHSLTTELRILMLHGTLHLLCYDHETDSGQMYRLEQKLRRQLRLQ